LLAGVAVVLSRAMIASPLQNGMAARGLCQMLFERSRARVTLCWVIPWRPGVRPDCRPADDGTEQVTPGRVMPKARQLTHAAGHMNQQMALSAPEFRRLRGPHPVTAGIAAYREHAGDSPSGRRHPSTGGRRNGQEG
jgi:hypothetical protein